MDDWRIALELALRLGAEIDFATVDELTDELARVAPSFDGVTSALLTRARDGVVLPLRDHQDEIVLRTRALSILAEDGSGASWDPIKVEGEPEDPDAPEPEAIEPEATEGDEPQAPTRVAPALWEWDGTAPDADVPRATRTLCASWWVGGSTTTDGLVSEAAALERVRRPFPLRISPHDAAGSASSRAPR